MLANPVKAKLATGDSALGCFVNIPAPVVAEVLAAVDLLARRVSLAGKVASTVARSAAEVDHWRQRGVRYLTTSAATLLGAAATECVQGSRESERGSGG